MSAQRRGDVLTRLDSLLVSAASSSSPGILKWSSSGGRVKGAGQTRSIRFPDNEELHEIIGYGGDSDWVEDSDDDDERQQVRYTT
jgi:hypothetical protein